MDIRENNYKNNLEFYLIDIHRQLDKIEDSLDSYDCCILSEIESLQDLVTQAQTETSSFYLESFLEPYTKEYLHITHAAENLSKKRHGALMIIQRKDSVTEHLHNGTPIGAKLSATLLETMFYPGSPLHDGGVLVTNDTIFSAGNFLPLSKKISHTGRLGARHRAAIGITERTDALVIVVSEETGRVSFAVDGQLYVIRV